MGNLEKSNKQKNVVFNASIDDLTIINTKLIEKFKENNVKYTADNLYSELELIKKDPNNSFIYHIVKTYLKKYGYINNKNIIIKT